MSRTIFDFLIDSPLFDDRAVEAAFSGMSDAEIVGELERYREHVIRLLPELQAEVVNAEESLGACFGTMTRSKLELSDLRRAALYFDRAVCDDPLFPLTRARSEMSNTFSTFFGYQGATGVDRSQLTGVIRQLKALQPLVGGNFVKLAPISLLHEPPDAIPLSYSPTLFEERIPPELLEWFHNRARVFPMRRVEGGWGIFKEDLKPSRGIAVEFEGAETPMVFHLTAMTAEQKPDDPHLFTFRQWIPDDPPSAEEFAAWVRQSINQYGGTLYSGVATDAAFAQLTSSMYLTNSRFAADLLSVKFAANGHIEEDLARLALQLDLPFIDDLTSQDLMAIRDNEDVFHNFRIAMQRELRGLRDEEDPAILARRLEDVRHELSQVQLREIDNRLAAIKVQGGAAIVGGIASLAAIIPTGGLSLLGLILAGAKGIQEGAKYAAEIRGHPAYFLWEVRRRAR